MKTEELIAALAADTLPQHSPAQRLARALPVAMAVSGVAFALLWGLRPDIVAALGSAAALKTLLPLGIAPLAAALGLALARPGAPWGGRAAALGLCAGGLAVAFAVALGSAGLAGLIGARATPSLVVCLLSIPALALVPLAATLWALSAGAALRPAVTGAAGGLAAGALAAALYSLYCDQDAALFALPAYATAILLVALAGAAIGSRLLRW